MWLWRIFDVAPGCPHVFDFIIRFSLPFLYQFYVTKYGILWMNYSDPIDKKSAAQGSGA
jgi:hypothetical protein